MSFRPITPTFAAAPAPDAALFAAAAAAGFALVINNRPDGEDPTQLSSAQAQALCAQHGLAYLHIPVSGMPGLVQGRQMRAALDAATGPVLAFCRSGTRSTAAFALAQALAGADIEATLASARAAGYELSALQPLMVEAQS